MDLLLVWHLDHRLRVKVVLGSVEGAVTYDCSYQSLQVVDARVDICRAVDGIAVSAPPHSVALVVVPRAEESLATAASLTRVCPRLEAGSTRDHRARHWCDAHTDIDGLDRRDDLILVPSRVLMPILDVIIGRYLRLSQYLILTIAHEVTTVVHRAPLVR